jgi:hypothetical protein
MKKKVVVIQASIFQIQGEGEKTTVHFLRQHLHLCNLPDFRAIMNSGCLNPPLHAYSRA